MSAKEAFVDAPDRGAAPERDASHDPAKKTYNQPRLTNFGSLAKRTLAGPGTFMNDGTSPPL